MGDKPWWSRLGSVRRSTRIRCGKPDRGFVISAYGIIHGFSFALDHIRPRLPMPYCNDGEPKTAVARLSALPTPDGAGATDAEIRRISGARHLPVRHVW